MVTLDDTLAMDPKDPEHPYAQTQHVSFDNFEQQELKAPFGYKYYGSFHPRTIAQHPDGP